MGILSAARCGREGEPGDLPNLQQDSGQGFTAVYHQHLDGSQQPPQHKSGSGLAVFRCQDERVEEPALGNTKTVSQERAVSWLGVDQRPWLGFRGYIPYLYPELS